MKSRASDFGLQQRKWGWSDALLALGLFFLSNIGVMFFLWGQIYPALNWPFSPKRLLALGLVVVSVTWLTLMGLKRFRLSDLWTMAAIGSVVSLVVVFYIRQYPVWSPVSDSASALQNGVAAVLSGNSPYSVTSHLGNPLSPLFGAYVLASPFVLIFGSVFIRGIFWIFVAITFLARFAGKRAALMFAVFILFSPTMRAALPNQNDYFVIAIEIAVSGWLGIWLSTTRLDSLKLKLGFWVTAGFFGISLADRFVFWVAAIPFAFMLVRAASWRRAVQWLAIAGVSLTVCLLIPLLWGVSAYFGGPIAMGLGKLPSSGIPNAGLIEVSLTLAVTTFFSWRARSMVGVFFTAAISMMFLFLMNGLVIALERGFYFAFAAPGSSYAQVAFNSSWLIFGLFALAVSRRQLRATAESSLLPEKDIAETLVKYPI